MKINKHMKYNYLFLIIFIFYSCTNDQHKLEGIIEEYQNHKGYDYDEYPLGNFSEDYFKNEKEFAENLLSKMSKIDANKLDENESILSEVISYQKLKKVLAEKLNRVI